MSRGSLFYKPKPRTKEIARKRWNWPSIFGRAVVKTCTVIGAVVLVSALLTFFMTATIKDRKTTLPGQMILSLTLDSGVGEQGREPSLMDPFPFYRPTIRQLVDTLDRAAADNRVKALAVNLEGGGIDIAHTQEIRAAVKRFRDSGKKAFIYSSSYGDFGQGLGSYYLASAFDSIWMQPVGMLSVAGIGVEVPFAKGLLDKVGVRPQFYQREEYKNAMESFTNAQMSGATRESTRQLVDTLANQMTAEIAADRKMSVQEFTVLVNKGLLTGDEALKAGLIDHLDYSDVLIEEIQKAVNGKPENDEPPLLAFEDYAATAPARHTGPKVALIYASGMIAPVGRSGEGVADAQRISDAILDAAYDDSYKAIVLRVNSPGGSPSASETIRRAVAKATAEGKQVIVSMGPVAASGGYWIAAGANRIFAMPATLTGSIGVIMGKFELSALWNKIGVNWEDVSWGDNAGLWSVNKPFDASEAERMNTLIDDIYAAFIIRVADGRKMDRHDVLKIAKGRVWTGEDAQRIGLVDDLGGLDVALDYAAVQIGVKNRHGISIDVLPRPEGALERLISLLGGQAQVVEGINGIEAMINRARVMGSGPVAYDPVLDMVR